MRDPSPVAQAHLAPSRRNTVRGINGAHEPPGHAEYVTCVDGEIATVVVDLHFDSSNVGEWDSVVFLSGKHREVFTS